MRLGVFTFLRSTLLTAAITLLSWAFSSAQSTPSQLPPTTAATPAPDPNLQAAPSNETQSIQEVPSQEGATQAEPVQPAPGQPAAGQAASGEDQGRFVFKKQVQEVTLHATVVDETGHPVTQLDRTAFTIFQNGVVEPITSFRSEDVPVAMGILIDNSGSMRDKRQKVNQAVLNLIRVSNPEDEVFVVNFSQNSYLDQDFTSDINLLQAALHQVSTRGSTALYDAVVASAVHLRKNPRLDKKVLLVITDGQDNMSRETLQDAMRQLQPNKGLAVYAIGLTDNGLTRAGREALQNLAASTGGVAFFPQSQEDVDAITRTIAHDIRSQYTLAYKPANLKPNAGYQAIRVEARAPGRGRLTVRTRTGYYPGETVR
jgi:VWFA-related protein